MVQFLGSIIKNHQLILSLAQEYQEELRKLDICFVLTLNANSLSVKKILASIKQNDLTDVILNIGEVSQKSLIEWYHKSYALFFPSHEETFGNGLIEGATIEELQRRSNAEATIFQLKYHYPNDKIRY